MIPLPSSGRGCARIHTGPPREVAAAQLIEPPDPSQHHELITRRNVWFDLNRVVVLRETSPADRRRCSRDALGGLLVPDAWAPERLLTTWCNCVGICQAQTRGAEQGP